MVDPLTIFPPHELIPIRICISKWPKLQIHCLHIFVVLMGGHDCIFNINGDEIFIKVIYQNENMNCVV